jgi:hypothetical protein
VGQLNSDPRLHDLRHEDNARNARGVKVTAFFYWLHLALPAFLVVDSAISFLRGKTAVKVTSFDGLVFWIALLWLLTGIAIPMFRRSRCDYQRTANALVALYAAYVVIASAELFVRLFWNVTPPIPGSLPPGVKVTYMDPKVTSGVSGIKKFSINPLGLRGTMPPPVGSAYRILAVGASTTICANLDDSEAWPQLVMDYVNASIKPRRVWVGNSAIPGLNTVHHLVLMQWLPGALPVNMVIFLTGGNDLNASLAFEGRATEALLEKEAGYQGALPAGTRWRTLPDIYPLYRRLKIFAVIRQAGKNVKLRFSRPAYQVPVDLEFARRRRAAAPVLSLPDLSIGLKEYRGRLIALQKRCRDTGLPCLFLTEPTMWRRNLSPSEERTFWQGYIGRWESPKGYVTSLDMERAMDMYNRTLLDVCAEEKLECYDLAADIPKETTFFYDDTHFTEAGARLVGQKVTMYLLSRPPFSQLN